MKYTITALALAGSLTLLCACWLPHVSMHAAVIGGLLLLGALNMAVSIAVAVSAAFSARQKVLQIAIVWIMPVLGGVLIGVFLLSQRGNGPVTGYRSERDEDLSQLWYGSHPPDQHH